MNGESVTPKDGESKLKAGKSGNADIMTMSYKEVLEQMLDEKERDQCKIG